MSIHEGQLCAGAARTDITPEMGIQLAGDLSRYRPVEEIRAPLYANALVCELDGRKICWVSADVTAVMAEHSRPLRERIASHIGTAVEAVTIHALQSHSAPVVGNHSLTNDCPYIGDEIWWLKGGDDRYIAPFAQAVMEAVSRANERLAPVTLRLGRDYDGRVAFNRRFILRDGTACMLGQAPREQILCVEGPADPEVGVAVFEQQDGTAVAVMLHHTCHPTHGFPKRWVHPDWPGAWGEGVREILGDSCVPIVINGACGNVHHMNLLDPTRNDTIENMASKLTETASKAIESAVPAEVDTLGWSTFELELAERNAEEEVLESARKLIEDHPDPIWLDDERTSIDRDWFYSVAQLDLARRQKQQSGYRFVAQAIAIGPLALVAWPGEPFVEAQLEVKTNAPYPHLFVGHMCNDEAGYVPTAEAIERGGYETRPAFTSHLEAGALEKVTEQTKVLLRELRGA